MACSTLTMAQVHVIALLPTIALEPNSSSRCDASSFSDTASDASALARPDATSGGSGDGGGGEGVGGMIGDSVHQSLRDGVEGSGVGSNLSMESAGATSVMGVSSSWYLCDPELDEVRYPSRRIPLRCLHET